MVVILTIPITANLISDTSAVDSNSLLGNMIVTVTCPHKICSNHVVSQSPTYVSQEGRNNVSRQAPRQMTQLPTHVAIDRTDVLLKALWLIQADVANDA